MSTETLMTAAEFERIADQLGPCELVRGEVVPLSPGGVSHSRLIIKLGRKLDEWAEPRKGWVAGGEFGLITQSQPDTVRGADIVYYSHDRLPYADAPEGFTSVPPNLVVEIVGRHKSLAQMVEKAEEYLRVGVDRVWGIDPKLKRTHIFRTNVEPLVLGLGDALTDETILPGFECRINALL